MCLFLEPLIFVQPKSTDCSAIGFCANERTDERTDGHEIEKCEIRKDKIRNDGIRNVKLERNGRSDGNKMQSESTYRATLENSYLDIITEI